MDRKDEELWIRRVRESLKDYSESPPKGGWAKLENELSPSWGEKRIYSYRIWASVAAILLLAISAVTLYFIQSPVGDGIRNTPVPVLSAIPDVMPDVNRPEQQTARIEPADVIRLRHPEKRPTMSVSPAVGEGNVADTVSSTADVVKADVVYKDKENEDTASEARTVSKTPNKGKLNLPVEGAKKRNKGKWAFGVSVNSGGVALSGDQNSDFAYVSEKLGFDYTGGVVNVPQDAIVGFENGMPYMLQVSEAIDWDHHQPISFGLSVRKELSNRFSVETGLTYTLLRSDMNVSGLDSRTVKQKLHYIGIPVRANWSFVDSKPFNLYMMAGGAVEKCVYGELGSEKHTVKPLQFSLNGGVGAQYNLAKQIGIYIEPGVAYFFDDGSSTETIRKENPFSFTLQAGLRFTY